MADSENSRTLPSITRGKENRKHDTLDNLPHVIDRRNLLPVTARLLSALIAETRQPREIGPTPIREMWPRWYASHQRHLRANRLKKKLERELLKEAGGPPVVMLLNPGKDGTTAVRSFAEINRIASQLDAEQLYQARAELRKRRRQWKEADQRLGYSAIATLDRELAERSGISGRVMWITRPSSLVEVTAKLHSLIVMQDPDLKLIGAPWPELRTMLKDLILITEKCRQKSSDRPKNPGKAAGARSILNLAMQYQNAAAKLGNDSSKPNQIPQRVLAFHAIELYLNAFLLAKGVDPIAIRGFQHDLGELARIATEAGLVMRKRTMAHLAILSKDNEYHIIRYAPELVSTLSQVNRVMASLEELSRKVRAMLRVHS